MSLKERIALDNHRVFMNHDHFAEEHTWNGRKFTTVPDADVALKRKNNNVVDISCDNDSVEQVVYVCREDWPSDHYPMPNEHGYFDNKPMKILQVQNDCDILTILLVSPMTKGVTP